MARFTHADGAVRGRIAPAPANIGTLMLMEMDDFNRGIFVMIIVCLTVASVSAFTMYWTALDRNAEASDWRPARAVDEGSGRANASAGIATAGMIAPAAGGHDVAGGLPAAAAAAGGMFAFASPAAAAMPPEEKEDAASLAGQAEIAACLADEARRMVDAWELDMRSSRGHAPQAYVEGLERMIAAGTDSARAMDAWAHVAGTAAADGEVTAGEAEVLWAVERNMADARAAANDAIGSIPTWQRVVATDWQVPSIATGSRLANTLAGEGTECY